LRAVDGVERGPLRVEHLLEGFHQMLEQVKPISDLGGLGCPLARPIGLGSGPSARDDLHPRGGSSPLRQGLGLTIGPQGNRPPAFRIDQYRAIALACAEREIIHAADPRQAAAWEWQATDHTQERLAADHKAQTSTPAGTSGPAQREP
jgi:hypothetical protein